MVRLVFRPYSHVRRTICKSVSLKASTRVSPGFAVRTNRSPSFGSHHECSYSNPSLERPVGGAVREGLPTFRFRSAEGFFGPNARIHVRLLGPCYKTGRPQPFRRRPWNAGATHFAVRRRPLALHVDAKDWSSGSARDVRPEARPFCLGPVKRQ